MLVRTCDPQLIVKEKDLKIVQEKMLEFSVEKISMFTRPDNTVSIHLYGEKTNVNKLISWLENDFDGTAELEE